MKVLGIDPGPEQSAVVVWDGKQILHKDIMPNDNLVSFYFLSDIDFVAIEMVACYGMPVGVSIFETVFWIGRFWQRLYTFYTIDKVYRKDIKLHFCNNLRAKDSNIRQALIDRLGKPGVKKKPGVTYGVKKDMWSALAIAIFWHDTVLTSRGI